MEVKPALSWTAAYLYSHALDRYLHDEIDTISNK